MKTKLIPILILIPMIGTAHSGHQHHAADIIFNPLMWLDHFMFILFIGVIFSLITHKLMKKFFPEMMKSFHQKLGLK